ncbi:MAG: DNA repair protein RadA [Bacillota bacterium]|nr:DNA repair protein RadA [Bacillota bacterium]
MKKSKTVFLCDNCGYESVKWVGRCPVCDAWNSFKEMKAPSQGVRAAAASRLESTSACPVGEVDISEGQRFTLGGAELDVLFGGGLVVGSVILIGGEPGIGKSTFLTQIAADYARRHGKVLYATGEESLKQVRLRAERIGAEADDFYLMAENDLTVITENIKTLKPGLLIVDSIQTLFNAELDSIPGSVGQIRECTALLLEIAKKQQVTIMIAGHVTKEGVIAGPRLLEHMVDVVMYFEGQRHQGFRILRAVKNRFGSTNEVALLDMTEHGLIPFDNPSAVFLAQRDMIDPGNAVGAIVEGTRPFLLEIQALVTKTSFGNPRRLATGIEYNRLLLIIAVLEKVLGLPLAGQDVYLNITGGLRIDDPSSDLAVAAAIASSYRNLPLKENTILLGEIGLGGEVRGVGDVEKRVKEGKKFGFKTFILPSFLAKEVRDSQGVELIPVRTLKDAFVYIF